MADTFIANSTLGALQIGLLVSYALLGIFITQSYVYYCRFPEDNWKLKCMVAFVWICELAQSIFFGHTLYTETITYYGKPELLFLGPPFSFDVGIFFNGCIASCVQGFFSYRIYTFSGKLYIPCFTWCLALARFVADTTLFIGSLSDTSVSEGEARWGRLTITAWSLSVVNDVAISLSLVYFLHRQRRHVFTKTTVLIDKLIAWTIETGMTTSLFSVLTLICYLTMPTNFIWIALQFISSRLFSNSVVASLNSRTTLRAAMADSVTLTYHSTSTSVINSSHKISQPQEVHIEMKNLTTV